MDFAKLSTLDCFHPTCHLPPSGLDTFLHRMDGIGPAHVVTPDVNNPDDDDFKIKGAAAGNDEGKDTCTICLEPITDRAVAVPCDHLTFDFLCLVSWLQERSRCPLCNTEVSEVQYEFRGPDDFKTYRVPQHGPLKKNESEYQNVRRRRGQDFIRRRSRRAEVVCVEDPALERRRRVYRERLYALHVGANRVSGYRDFTASDFANSVDLQSRARMFLRRELQVFSFLDTVAAPRGGNREFLIEYIVAVLKANELKGANGRVEDMVAEYVGRENARLLLHQLESWLRSPFKRLDEWDREVQYAEPQSSGDVKASSSG